MVAADGTQVVVDRDTEGRLATADRRDESGRTEQTIRLQYDDLTLDRLASIGDTLGTMATFAYAQDAVTDSRPNWVDHPLGQVTRYLYDLSGAIVEQSLASGSPEALHRQYLYDVEHRVTGVLLSGRFGVSRMLAAQYDDFGRKVAFASAEHGLHRYVWDAADRLLARTDESGHASRFEYDHAGRTIAAGADGMPRLTRYRYEGRLNTERRSTYDVQPNRAKEVRILRYDAFGRIVFADHWQALPTGADGASPESAASATRGYLTRTQYRYDPTSGRLAEKTLTDAAGRDHVTGYEWNAKTGALATISFNGQRVVENIEHSAMGGLTSMSWGNGMSERLSRDARGRLIAKEVRFEDDKAPLLYASWTYDAENRLIADHTRGTPHTYTYDARGRLTQDEGGKMRSVSYDYDALGNRVRSAYASDRRESFYENGKLIASVSTSEPGELFKYDATGARQASGSLVDGAPIVHTSYDTSGRPTTVGEAAPQVRYAWGMLGERTSKTVGGLTTWFHYETSSEANDAGLRLAEEGTNDGAIVSHYLYLDGRPVARVDTPEPEGQIAGAWYDMRQVVLGWFGLRPRATPRVYAIHTDQRGAPIAATGQGGRIVWSANYEAFGRATPTIHEMTLNLRLPGQYFDAETGTHYNVEREYEAKIGRYLSADPLTADPWLELGQSLRLAGDNAYAYVSDQPLTKADSQGLYESDVHFYMTYFLSIVAGMGADDARTMALATQYIDDNPQTSPLPDGTGTWDMVTSTFKNQKQLKDYHFVLSDPNGITLSVYQNHSVGEPNSPQLQALQSYALPKNGQCGTPNNTSLQFMGEYLHAFEDTFSHRDAQNEPIDAVWKVPGTSYEWGIGHGRYGHQPDFTYDQGGWNTRESRTFEMELETYSKVTSYMAKMNYGHSASHLGKATSLSDPILIHALQKFNATEASEESGNMVAKINVLNNALSELGYSQTIKWVKKGAKGPNSYDEDQAAMNREKNFSGLNMKDYPAAILP